MTNETSPPSGGGVPPSPPRTPRAPMLQAVEPSLRPSEVCEVPMTLTPGAPVAPPTLAVIRLSRPPSPNEASVGRERYLEGVLVYLDLLLKHAPVDDLAGLQEVVSEVRTEIANVLKKP